MRSVHDAFPPTRSVFAPLHFEHDGREASDGSHTMSGITVNRVLVTTNTTTMVKML